MVYFILGGLTVWVILSCVVIFVLDRIDPTGWDDSILFTVFFPAAILVGIYFVFLILLKKIKIILRKVKAKKK